jgi:hypothetical protein
MESYATRPGSESRVTRRATEQREVWLRGNTRPVAGLATVIGIVAAAILPPVIAAGSPRWLVWAILGGAGAASAGLVAIGRAAARPRLIRAGEHLEIRLSPTAVERVPLDVVECVFRGTEPLSEGSGDAPPRFRVGTLVVRFAERAAAWRKRPTFGPWGTWDDGHAVIDGRWCEPLSRPTVERIAAALVEAKRQLTAERGA